jgi:hypothetical protein
MKNKKGVAVIIAVLMLTLSFTSVGYGKSTMEVLSAYYKNISIFRDGIQATFTHEPFIVDGTTYVPVRDMSELLGETVTFDQETYRIDITSTTNVAELQAKILEQQLTISSLESQIATLNTQIDDDYDLNDLEDELNDGYYELDDIDVNIEVDGDEDGLEVYIYVEVDDLYEDQDGDEDVVEDYLYDIYDEIMDYDEFEDAEIYGEIEDEDGNTYEFEFDEDGYLDLNW